MVELLSVIFQIFGEGLKGGLSVISGILSELFKTDHRHKAEFGNGRFLSKSNKGFNVNGKSLTPLLSRRGFLIAGESGSGKGTGSLIRSCITVDGSQFIHAPTMENFQLTSGYRSQTDRILFFSPTHPQISIGYNPMLRANTLAEINRLSFLVISLFSSEKEKKSFWNTKAQELLTCLILILKKPSIPSHFQNLTNVAYLLDYLASESTRPYLDSLFMDLADDWLYQKYQSITSQSDTVFQGICSSCQSALQFFDLDDDMRKLTSTDDLGDFEDIRAERTTFYLVSSTTKGEYYSPIITILLDQYFELFFSRIPDSSERDVYFHIDEAPLIHLDWDILCANVRKHFGSICLVAQDPYSQFASAYGSTDKRNAILANLKTKAYYSITLDQAKRLEQELGVFTYTDDFDEQKVKNRSLRTASELMLIPEDSVLITQTGTKPILTKYTPYYRDSACKKHTKLPPYELNSKEHSPVRLIPLKTMYPNATDHV